MRQVYANLDALGWRGWPGRG